MRSVVVLAMVILVAPGAQGAMSQTELLRAYSGLEDDGAFIDEAVPYLSVRWDAMARLQGTARNLAGLEELLPSMEAFSSYAQATEVEADLAVLISFGDGLLHAAADVPEVTGESRNSQLLRVAFDDLLLYYAAALYERQDSDAVPTQLRIDAMRAASDAALASGDPFIALERRSAADNLEEALEQDRAAALRLVDRAEVKLNEAPLDTGSWDTLVRYAATQAALKDLAKADALAITHLDVAISTNIDSVQATADGWLATDQGSVGAILSMTVLIAWLGGLYVGYRLVQWRVDSRYVRRGEVLAIVA